VELFALLEIGIGITASSLPSIRHMFKKNMSQGDSATPGSLPQDAGKSLITIGNIRIRGRLNPETAISLTTIEASNKGQRSWTQLHDSDSERDPRTDGIDQPKGRICTQRTYSVERA
jgi:hypothetical protein